MANGEAKRIRFSDLIGSNHTTWEDTRIILDGGTGTGKTYFILRVLAPYARLLGKRILYLCNRKKLKEQVKPEIGKRHLKDTVTAMTYQALETSLNKDSNSIPFYDYIVADECHYFTNDALFNEYTDISYHYLYHQKNNVVIYISATAKIYFHWLKKTSRVLPEHCFEIPKSYDYVNGVYFYNKKFLQPKVDDLLENEPDSKIIIFCNSYRVMKELHKKYGDRANYMASERATEVKEFCDTDCVYGHPDGTVTFDKRLLITTKVMDNGVDIKDRSVKHIFCEIFDVDSAIQALGRKRKIDAKDTCTFYIKDYTGQAIQGLINSNNYQTEPVLMYETNYDKFQKIYGKKRKRIRENRIFYAEFSENKRDSRLKINKMRLQKYMMDLAVLKEMKEKSYKEVMSALLGKDLAEKTETLTMQIDEKDSFLEYLKSIESKWLYDSDRKEIVKRFETIGVKLRRAGINTLNGALEDNYGKKYKCRFRNRQLDEDGKVTRKTLVDNRRNLEDGSPNPMRKKAYWILE